MYRFLLNCVTVVMSSVTTAAERSECVSSGLNQTSLLYKLRLGVLHKQFTDYLNGEMLQITDNRMNKNFIAQFL